MSDAMIQNNLVPPKLLRIEFSEYCNYRCSFCCWTEPDDRPDANAQMDSPDLEVIIKAMVRTGCRNFHLTGGEPLLHADGYLSETLRVFSKQKDIEKFWITTNGSRLKDAGLLKDLYASGLRHINVSIGAESNRKYRAYSGTSVELDAILRGVEKAAGSGFEISVHVPLSTDGVSSFDEFEVLLHKLQKIGVKQAFYFRLHKTPENSEVYRKLYVDQSGITNGFASSGSWALMVSETGRRYFSNGHMKVNVPRDEIVKITQNCADNDCGDYCQGVYAAYLLMHKGEYYIRACHRDFDDRRNMFPVDMELLKKRDVAAVAEQFNTIWKFAYEL